jgi:hypothetical protein
MACIDRTHQSVRGESEKILCDYWSQRPSGATSGGQTHREKLNQGYSEEASKSLLFNTHVQQVDDHTNLCTDLSIFEKIQRDIIDLENSYYYCQPSWF